MKMPHGPCRCLKSSTCVLLPERSERVLAPRVLRNDGRTDIDERVEARIVEDVRIELDRAELADERDEGYFGVARGGTARKDGVVTVREEEEVVEAADQDDGCRCDGEKGFA